MVGLRVGQYMKIKVSSLHAPVYTGY